MNPCSTCNENVSRACFEETAAYIGRGGFTGILGNQSPKIQHVKVPLNKVVCLFYE
jgi:hypothetical protein